MARWVFLLLMVGMFASLPTAEAKLLPAYTLVGTDKTGDAKLTLVTGVDWPACETGLSCQKYDVASLEMGQDDASIHFKLNPVASYWGTSGIIYAVHFQAGGKKFFTCWNIHSAGTTGQN